MFFVLVLIVSNPHSYPLIVSHMSFQVREKRFVMGRGSLTQLSISEHLSDSETETTTSDIGPRFLKQQSIGDRFGFRTREFYT